MRRGSRLHTTRLLTAGLLAGIGGAAAAEERHKPQHHASRPAAAPATANKTENLVVHGQKNFAPAPMPNQAIHDPADVLRDPNTGAPMDKFGGAYIDANPVPPVNPGLQGDRSPVDVGVPR